MKVSAGEDQQAGTPLDPRIAAWRSQYESLCVQLSEDRSDPYLEAAAYDGALTSVLLLIVHEMDGSASAAPDGRTHSARRLLDFIGAKTSNKAETTLRVVRAEGWTSWFAVRLALLREALDRTQATRHGRTPPQLLEQRHIDALLELGKHPDISDISAIVVERALEVAREYDSAARAQATDLLHRLPDDEVQRLADPDRLNSLLPWTDPKESLDRPEYDDCPVCWNMSFQPDGFDYFGGVHSAGQCVVCGYLRSEAIAYDEAVGRELTRLVDRPD